ncbi:hypothetical protein [Cloacibacillus evryensis]|uniref:hypothetical protein n=1 Tax=Cloacibacillus evryensis TaxID=508460 RepID=UPI00210BE0E8|nr:hypothetical protein [Cloacibacillus evryensis]MCQ4764271.1 hypothetical protein [Cloacibacillus evryensis]
MKRGFFLTLLLLCTLCAAPRAEAVKISIEIPSVRETVLASGRDFYVAGRIDREGVPAAELPVDIRVEVAEAGLMRDGVRIPLRAVESRVDKASGLTPRRDIWFRYEGRAPWTKLSPDELMASPPPDLVYRHGDPQSFYDPRLKAAVTENGYAALIQGGCTKDFDSGYKNLYKDDLEWKYFRVTVSAVSGGRVLAERHVDVMLGSVPDKMLARFSPAAHMKKVTDFAHEKGYRIYGDPFPGYWFRGLDGVYEIPLRWRLNDGLEYASGRVHAVLYNIPEKRSASQEVEFGRIAFEGRLFRDDEVWFYFYDAGEPSLKYSAWDGEHVKEGRITKLDEGERLRFTRAELGSRPEKYFPTENAGRVDWNVYDSVAAAPGEAVTFFGVTPPIQPPLSEVEQNDDGTFTIKNRIAKIRYRFEEKSLGEVIEKELPTGLERCYDPRDEKWTSPSIYEFRHTITLPGTAKKRLYTVTVEAFDSRGAPVDGTEAMFYLWVR